MNRNITDGPQTVQELLLFLDTYPERAHLYRPSPHDARMMGIDPELLWKPEPYPEAARRRMIATGCDGPELCEAFRMFLLGGEA